MKKIISIILLSLTCTVCAMAQTPASLADVAKAYKDKCPVSVADGTNLVNVSFTDEGFVFDYDVIDDLYDSLESLGGIFHDSLLAEMQSSPDQNTQKLMSLAKKGNVKILQRFKNSKGKQFEITFLPAEL